MLGRATFNKVRVLPVLIKISLPKSGVLEPTGDTDAYNVNAREFPKSLNRAHRLTLH